MKIKLDSRVKVFTAGQRSAEQFKLLRQQVHRRLIGSIDDEGAGVLSDSGEVRRRLRWIIQDLELLLDSAISESDRQQIEREIVEEIGGLGPLAPLMLDPNVSDILINGPFDVWVDRFGRLEQTSVRFDDDLHVRRFLDRIISGQGRQLDASSPMVDARLSDGSRLHAVIPPLCAVGPVVSIRRFRANPVTAEELVNSGFLSQPMLELLKLAVISGQNIVVAGGAAAGKTTLLNVISKFIPADERVVTVEETAELKLDHPHVIPLESRPINLEGRGGVSLSELVRTALRMRADRIIVGEVRGVEVMDMLQAMNVGHDGSLTTVHANSPKDVLRRLEALAHMGDAGLPRESIRDMIGSAVQIIIQVMRFRDGSRRVVSISEVLAGENGLGVAELFRFRPDQNNAEGKLSGRHEDTGAAISFLGRAQATGFGVSKEFQNRVPLGADKRD